MKKALAIILLLIFLFNIGGYYWFFLVLKYQANKDLTFQLDSNTYAEEETIELKIPVSLPYPLQERDFERVTGKFEHKGEYYKLVKQKLENDTLYIVCLQDKHEKRLVNTMKDFASLTNDLSGKAKKAVSVLTKLLKDTQPECPIALLTNNAWCLEIIHLEISQSIFFEYENIQTPPPKV